jgi:hypothetical protein
MALFFGTIRKDGAIQHKLRFALHDEEGHYEYYNDDSK